MYHLSLSACMELAGVIHHNWVNGNRNLVRAIIFQLSNPQLLVVLKNLEDYYQLHTTTLVTEPVIDNLNSVPSEFKNDHAETIIQEASGL